MNLEHSNEKSGYSQELVLNVLVRAHARLGVDDCASKGAGVGKIELIRVCRHFTDTVKPVAEEGRPTW